VTYVEICALYFGDDPNGVVKYFDSQMMRNLGIHVMSVEGTETFGGPLRWDLRFQTTKDGFKKLTNECDNLGLLITSVNINQPPPIMYSMGASYVTAPADKIAYPEDKIDLTVEELAEIGSKHPGWFQGQIGQMKQALEKQMKAVQALESPKKTETPIDTSRHFDMDFDDSDLT